MAASPYSPDKVSCLKIRGTHFGGPNNEDYRIWVSILASPYLGNYHVNYGLLILSFFTRVSILEWAKADRPVQAAWTYVAQTLAGNVLSGLLYELHADN